MLFHAHLETCLVRQVVDFDQSAMSGIPIVTWAFLLAHHTVTLHSTQLLLLPHPSFLVFVTSWLESHTQELWTTPAEQLGRILSYNMSGAELNYFPPLKLRICCITE